MNLQQIASEIREILENKRKQLKLTFVEDTHSYTIKKYNSDELTSEYPSVSSVIKQFYIPFPAEEKSLQMSNGDLNKQKLLLEAWKQTAVYANNVGSRVHFELEKDLINRYNNYKDVRKPIFECDEQQMLVSNNMITAGKSYLDLMIKDRKAILLDTESVLGCNQLCYTGQPDKVWLMLSKTGELGFVVTDYKSNKPKNFEVHHYTGKMLTPFEKYDDTALTHYYIQLPLYAKLILAMLKNSKYNNIKFLGAVVVLLKENSSFVEYKIPTDIINKVMSL